MDDIQKLIEEHGLTPVPKTNPQIDSLVNQFGLVPAQTEGGYGVGTFAKDVTKNVAAGAIPGVLGAPEAIQAAANQQVRTSQAIPTDIVNLLANPQALTNKFVESLGFKPIFREEDKTLIPEEMTKKQNMAMDEVLSKGKIPQLKSLSELGNKLGQNISQTVSPEMQLAMANFVPTGSLDDIAHGRLDKISLGAKPSMLGLAGQFSNVFGSVMPGMIGTLVTKDPRYMEAFGFGQAGSEAIGNARQYIQSLDDNQLSNNSPYFQELLRAGYDSKTARMMTEEKAADTAAAAEGVIGMLGGNFTANLITGKFDKALISSVRNRALNIAAKTAKGAVTGATEEGLQEMSEGIASDLGINKTVAKEIGADAFSNLILGAIGGGGPGAVSGARAKSEEQKVQEEEKKTILQEGKNVTVEGAPPVPPAPKKPATITEEELATEEEAKPPKEEAAIPSAKPGFDQWRTEKGITFGSKEEYEAALPGLKKQYEAETSGAPAAEEPISEKEAKMLKGMEVQKRITAANEAKLLTEAEFDKVFNLYDNDKLDAANKQLDKILASKQAPTEVTPTAEETLAKLKADQAAAKEAKAKREPITLETVSAELPEGKLSSEYKLDSDGVFTRTDDVAGEKQDLTFVTKDGAPEWVPNSEVAKDKLEPVKVDETRAKSMIGAEKSFIETEAAKYKKPVEEKTVPLGKKISKGIGKYLKNIADAKTPEERSDAVNELRSVGYTEESAKEQYPGIYESVFNKKPVEKTQAEINRERQAEKKTAAEKSKQPVDKSAVKDLIEGKIKKVLGWTIYKRKEDPDFWYVQSPENHAENKIGPGDDVSTNLDTARARIEQHINDAEYEARKAAEKPAEKKTEPTAPKKGTSLYAAMLLADAKKNGDIDPSYFQGLMYKEMSSNVKDYTAAIEKAIADTKAKKEEKVAKVEEPIKVEKIEPIKEVEGKVSKEYQTALNKSRKANKAFASAQDGYRKRLINDEEFLAARKRYDDAMAEYDIAFAKEQEKPEPKEVKVTPKKTAPVSSEEEQLIQDAVMFAKAANRTNLDEAKIRETVENARIKEPESVITKLKGSVENLKNQAKDNLIRLASDDYREQVGVFIGKDSELVNAIKGGALNIEGKEYAPAFYKAYNINPDKIKKPTVGNVVDAQVVKFESGIFVPGDISKADYVEAATRFLESPLTAKIPTKTQGKIDSEDIKDVTPLPIEKKIAVKNKTYEDHKAALSDFTAPQDIRYYLKGIYMDQAKGRMMATDGHRGAIINDANFDGVPKLEKGKDIVAPDNSVIEGQFPDMDRVIPKKHLVKAEVINTKEIGDYARGIQKAWRYISGSYNPVMIKIGGNEHGFNADYVVDMANLFSKMGYDTFKASVDSNGKMYATSPDDRVQQVVMGMRKPSSPFSVYAPGKKAEKKIAKVEVKEEPKSVSKVQEKIEGTDQDKKAVANIRKDLVRFASGMSGLSDLISGSYWRSGHQNYGVGFDVGLLSKNAIDQMAHYVVNMDTQVFIDSGAFSHFRKQLKGKEVADLDFDKILAKYGDILYAIGQESENQGEKVDYPRPMLVMPDIVGDQKASLELIDHHKDWIASHIWSNLAQPIIPLQKGELTLSEAYDNVIETLKSNKRDLDFNEKKIIFGIPSNAEAVSRYDLIEFLQTSKPARIHFLGAAADSKLNPLLQIVAHVSPETKVTADASKVRSAILNGVAKGKTRDEAIKDALYEAEDPMVLMDRFGSNADIIDIIATEINPEQIKLLTNQTSKLSTDEKSALEEHYGVKEGTDEFFKRIREDIITYTNKGADAVAKAIRDIIAKLQAGLLAVAMVFNPAYMSQQSAVVYPTKTVTEEVRATVPDSAKEMSDSGKKAYAALQPALQSSDKFFTIVDKPTSKVFVFQPDGSLLVKDNVVLGMAMGDTYVGGTDFKANRITPAGLMKVKAEKGSGTYDGKTIYTVGNVKEGWNTAFMHTVYLKESDAAARKAALATGEGARLSHGCVNASPEVMAKISEDNRMDGSHVFVVPDNQAKTDDYIANNVSNEDLTRETVKPITKTTQVPEKPTKPELVAREEKAVEQKTQAQINQERQQAKLAAAKVADEGTFFNNFDADFNKGDFEEGLMGVRDEQIKWQSYLSRQLTATMKDIANYGSDLGIQAKLNYLREAKQEVKTALNNSKEERRGVDWFVARAAEAKAKKQLSPEAKAVVDTLAAKYPSILSGLKLSVVQSKKAGVAGNFRPFERLVTIYHSSYSPIFNPKSAERQAVTMRHEISHSLEQLMTPQAQVALVEAWASSLDKAIKKYPGEAEQAFFQKVLDFVEHPTEANMKRATNAMPDMSFYQYVNPSEFWAVNAEKLMKSQLGTPWARFVKAVQKLWEAIKSVFGFDNRYAIHREFDRIMKGDQQQMTQTMLADYLKQNGEEITFLNNVEDIDDFMDTYDRPDAPLHYSPSVMDRVLGGKKAVKELSRKMKENPMLPVNNMVSNVGRGVLYTRVKNVWFGAGLDEADRRKYEGQLRDSEGHVVASIAVTNALHAGHVGTQVMIQGKLEFDPITQMFRAVKDKFSLANVVRIKNKLEKRIGAQRAANLIQAYFEAKRSRSIVNEYLGRTAELTKFLEEQMDPSTSDERQLKLNKLIADAEEDVKNIQRALDKVNMDDDQIDEAIAFEDEYPELREMMDNWTSVNQNMIDNMEFSGIISKKRAETLRNIKDYVPWYRIQDDATDVHSAQGIRTLTNVGREKTFKEGTTELEIDDIVDNMIHNIMMLTRNSMRNYAANRVAMEYAERNDKGKLQVYPTEDREKGIFNILAGGRRINIKIADPLIAESVLGLENIEIPMGNILRFFANGLRWSVTINPIFQAKQLFMDAPTAALVTGVKHPFRLWAGAFGGFIRGLKPHDPIVDLLKSYGIGGYRSAARSPEHELKQEIGILNKNYFDKAVSILDHISDASDYAQRVAVYKRVLAETGDQMQAIVQANNVIDFQKKGSGKAAQVLTRTVSFMNAYAQQIDVLAQALSGKGLKGLKRQQAFARLVYTGGLLASVSLLYCMAVGDDDEYQKMDDQTKMRNFIIPKSLTKTIGMDHAVMLPMSTSAAFFFKAVPEMLYNKIVNEGTKNQVDNTRLRNALAKAAADSLLGPTPFPTGLKPFAEIGLNYNFFTGGTITPKGMEKLDPSRQYTNTTSELGKIFSKLSGGVLNPIQADHLMRSLGGTVAATAMWGSNLFSGNRPDAEAKANPLYGSFIAADVPRGREDLFYDLQERADRANETFKDLSKKQHPTEAKQWFEENKQLIIASGFTTGAATSLKSINAEIRRLSDLPAEKMSAEEKRQKITFYKNKKNDILEQTIAFRLKAGL